MAELNTWYYSAENSCVVANGQTRSEYKVRLAYKFISQNIQNNTSLVLSRLQVRSTSSSYATYGYNQTTVLQGNTLSSKSFDMRDTNTWQNFGEKELTFTHDADGSKTKTLTGSFTTTATSGYSLKSGSVSVTVEFPRIPRASSIDSIQGNMIGSNVTVNIKRASDSFLHNVFFTRYDGAVVQVGSSVGTSCTFLPALSDAEFIPNSSSGTTIITVDTYSGSTKIGSVSQPLILYVPDSVVPSISAISISEGNSSVSSNWGVYVQGKSTLKVVTSASGSYNSTIKSYKITGIDNNTYYSSNFTSSTLQTSGTRTITVTVTDSRGRTATKTTAYTCVAYSNPTISVASVNRCNADGTDNEEGTYVKYSFKASVASVNNKNTYSYKLGYKVNTDSSYTYITIDNSAYTLDKNDVVISGVTFSVDNSYDFQFLVTDYFTSISVIKNIGTGFTLMDFRYTGKGIGIGKVSEKDALEIAMLIEIWKALELKSSGSEGGELRLYAPESDPTQSGCIIDQNNNKLRFFGIASKDGKSRTGVGAIIDIDFYEKIANLSGYTIKCNNVRSDISSITSLDFNNNTGNYSGKVDYVVKDGVCYLSLFFKVLSPTTGWTPVFNKADIVPRPLFTDLASFAASTQINKAPVRVRIQNDGNIVMHGGEASDTDYVGTLVYPCVQ